MDVPAELVDIPLWVRPARKAVVPEKKEAQARRIQPWRGSNPLLAEGFGGWAANLESSDLFKGFYKSMQRSLCAAC